MKKLLLLGAAALLASTLGASAQSVGKTTTIVLGGHADMFMITQQGDDFFAQQHKHLMGAQTFGVGMTASTPYIYKGIMVTDFGKNGQYQACYDFEYPFRDGGYWLAYRTTDGQHVQYLGHGTYRVLPKS
jgi:hypothetical protein